MTELVDSARIAEILPYSIRQIQLLAKRGDIPSAQQVGARGKWLFDEMRVRRWLKQKETESCQSRIYTKDRRANRGRLDSSTRTTRGQ